MGFQWWFHKFQWLNLPKILKITGCPAVTSIQKCFWAARTTPVALAVSQTLPRSMSIGTTVQKHRDRNCNGMKGIFNMRMKSYSYVIVVIVYYIFLATKLISLISLYVGTTRYSIQLSQHLWLHSEFATNLPWWHVLIFPKNVSKFTTHLEFPPPYNLSKPIHSDTNSTGCGHDNSFVSSWPGEMHSLHIQRPWRGCLSNLISILHINPQPSTPIYRSLHSYPSWVPPRKAPVTFSHTNWAKAAPSCKWLQKMEDW